MKYRLENCLRLHPIADWSEQVRTRKTKLLDNMSELPHWTMSSFECDSLECSSANFYVAHRLRGRPAMRWHNWSLVNFFHVACTNYELLSECFVCLPSLIHRASMALHNKSMCTVKRWLSFPIYCSLYFESAF